MSNFAQKQKPPQNAESGNSAGREKTFSRQGRETSFVPDLQGVFGNRLLQANEQKLEGELPADALPRFTRDFSRIPVCSSPFTIIEPQKHLSGARAGIQKKSLEVSNPTDANEREADEVARKVVYGQSAAIHGAGGAVNRNGEGSAEITPEFQYKLESSKGNGQSLDAFTRNEMESKIRADFSNVRIHTDSLAHNLSERINAKAFTYGSDIYFRNGNYTPNLRSGKELLAHELVHTQQQRSASGLKTSPIIILPKRETPAPTSESGDIIGKDVPFYKFMEDSNDPNDLFGKLQLGDQVEILERLDGGWTKVRRAEGAKVFEGYVRSVFVKAETEIVNITSRNLKKEEIDDYYNQIKKELIFVIWPGKSGGKSKNIESALFQFKKLFETGDKVAFTNVAMRLREEGYLKRLFWKLTADHMKAERFIISRLAVFLPPSLLVEFADRKAKTEGTGEAIKFGVRSIWNSVKKTFKGDDKTRQPKPDSTKNDPIPVDLNDIKQGAIDELKAMIGDKKNFLLSIDNDVSDFLDLKYNQLRYYLEKNDRENVVREVEDFFDLYQALLELLISDRPRHPFITKTLLRYAFMAWQMFKATPAAVAEGIKVTDQAKGIENVPISQLLKKDDADSAADTATTKDDADSSKVTDAKTDSSKSGSPPADDTKELKETIKEIVITEAQRVRDFLYNRLFPLFNKDEALLAKINKMIASRRKGEYKKLPRGVRIDDKTDQKDLERRHGLDEMTWEDLGRIWFYELGPKELGIVKYDSKGKKLPLDNGLSFGPKAWTTRQLRSHPSLQLILKYARQRAEEIESKKKETKSEKFDFEALVEFDVTQYFSALKSRDKAMIFLGSFYVYVTFDPDKKKTIDIRVYNEVGLESASRFGKDPKADPESPLRRTGVLDSRERGAKVAPIGGTIGCEWKWEEPASKKIMPEKTARLTERLLHRAPANRDRSMKD